MSAERPPAPAANSSPFCSFPLEVQLLTVVWPVSPLSIALPYISSVTPLSTAFTHYDRGGRVRTFSAFKRSDFSTCRPFLFITLQVALPKTPFFSQPSALPGAGTPTRSKDASALPSRTSSLEFAATCRLFALSLQRFHPSFRFFSAGYRHFFAEWGVAPPAALPEPGSSLLSARRLSDLQTFKPADLPTFRLSAVLSQRASYSQAAKRGKGGV
jgi:hypothetical protein